MVILLVIVNLVNLMKNYIEEFRKGEFKWWDTYQDNFMCINDYPLGDEIEAFITEAIQSAKKEAVEKSDKEWQIAIGHTCDACYKKIVNRMGQKAK